MSDSTTDNKLSLDDTLEGAISHLRHHYPDISGAHLDIGSGTGNLIRRIRKEYKLVSSACDYTDQFMELDGINVDVVDLTMASSPTPMPASIWLHSPR